MGLGLLRLKQCVHAPQCVLGLVLHGGQPRRRLPARLLELPGQLILHALEHVRAHLAPLAHNLLERQAVHVGRERHLHQQHRPIGARADALHAEKRREPEPTAIVQRSSEGQEESSRAKESQG